jgi:hypothetical protein
MDLTTSRPRLQKPRVLENCPPSLRARASADLGSVRVEIQFELVLIHADLEGRATPRDPAGGRAMAERRGRPVLGMRIWLTRIIYFDIFSELND